MRAGTLKTMPAAAGLGVPASVVRDRALLVAAFGAVYVIWGSTYLAIAWAVATIPPLTMIAARCLVAGGVLYAVSRARAGRPSAVEWRRALVAGVLLFVTGQAMLAWGETRVASGPAALLIASEPMFVALLGWGLKRSGAPTRAVWLALAVGFVGVAVMMAPGRLGGVDAVGALVIVVAALSWSLGMFFATPARDGSPVQTAAMQLIGGGAALVVVAAATGDLGSLDPGGVSGRSLASFLYLVVFGSLITYSAYIWLLRRVGPGRLSSHGYVNPMVAVAFGAMLAGESITPAVVLASLLILSSVVVLVRRG
ncbi:MAG TPA: EamA family transporter [Longimicrobiales bacterium]|nr:EamA family transporter [Longimicrobiales bacterium]